MFRGHLQVGIVRHQREGILKESGGPRSMVGVGPCTRNNLVLDIFERQTTHFGGHANDFCSIINESSTNHRGDTRYHKPTNEPSNLYTFT